MCRSRAQTCVRMLSTYIKAMHLRKATLADVELLQYWDTKPHVRASSGEDDWWDWPAELATDPGWRELLIAEAENRPIGVLQIIDPAEEETHYWGDTGPGLRAIDIWIGEEADLGRGLGTRMMTLALQRCFAADEVTAVLIDPLLKNTMAQKFYKKIGFEAVGPRVFEQDECLVMRIERSKWNEGV